MNKDFEYILSDLKVQTHSEWGAFIELVDYEHFDYIDDVLTEIFDVEYSFRKEINDSRINMYFESRATQKDVENAIFEINRFHRQNGKEYDLPSGT